MQTFEAVESDSFDKIEPTSAILVRVLQERRKAEEITAYFEIVLIEREEEMKLLKKTNERKLEKILMINIIN